MMMMMTIRKQFGFLCLIVALASVSVVGQSTSPSPAAQPAKSGAITGRVVNEKGQPLANARVSIRAFGSMNPGQSVSTDQDGRFEVTGLERMNYQVAAWLSAYAPQPRNPFDTQSSNVRVGDSVTLVLIKGGVITGTVTNQNGEPVVGVRVRARMIRDSDLLPAQYVQMSRERATDDRGIYRIYGLPTGTYVVWAGGSGFYQGGMDPFDSDVPTYAPASTRDEAAEIAVRAGEETANVDIRYRGESGRIVSGTVTGPATEQQMGIGIELTSVKDPGIQFSSMRGAYAQQGMGFSFQGVDDGDYYITARSFLPSQEWALSPSKRITVRGADVTGIKLVTQPLGAISGRVVLEESSATECTDKARPLFSEILVSAWHRETEATKEMPRFVWSLGAPAAPDAEGTVRLRNLSPGDYRFATQFSGKYWYLHSISFPPSKAPQAKPVDAARTWTTLKSGERLSGLTVTLARGAASLRGQVAIAEGETLPEKLIAYLVPAEREKADDVLRYFAVVVTPDGKIVLNNLAPGRYWILAQTSNDDRSPSTKLRLPDSTEMRSALRRAAEAAKTEVELKPCQNVVDFRLPQGGTKDTKP
jgi:Carboxypeptidase regulatory-like domain